MLRFTLLTFLVATQVSICVASSQLTGIVTDWSNGRPIENALVEIEKDSAASTDRFGRFTTDTLDASSVVLRVSKNGFISYSAMIVLADADMTEFNVELKPAPSTPWTEAAIQEAPRYRMDEVTISTTRAASDYPVTFSNLSREMIDRSDYGQDLPQLFTLLPNLYAYSDGGAGFGYSYLRLRGFNQNRVGVYLNGIPLNDSESHEVFWIDLPDFAEDTQDMQVQRGVGSSLYGAAALGGSINLMTKTPGLGAPRLRAESSYGSWNTRRASLQFESGRVSGRYGFAGRLSRMDSDGYRFGSWVKQWSYYFGASRFTTRHTSRVLFYGGPERTHLAYNGVTRDYLDGKATGDKETDRRFNPFTYTGEIDNFFQPHYELHDTWRLRDNLLFDNSLYLFRGDGYYDQFRSAEDLSQYFYTLPAESLTADVLRRRNIAESDGGWVPRATLTHKYGQTILGGELRLHAARHEGTVQWASELPHDIQPNQHYYDYRIGKSTVSGYVHNLITISSRFKAMADLQVKSMHYEMSDDQLFDVTLVKNFSTVDPRFGLTYQLFNPSGGWTPLTQLYTNLSWAKREPGFRDLYNAQDYYSSPLVAPNRFAQGLSGGEYIGPSLEMEELRDVELGFISQWQRANFGANAYWMTLTDAIVTDNGQLDDLGNLLSANAEKVVHQGIEIVGALEPVNVLKLSGNLALTDHKFARYSEVDWVTYSPTSRDGKRIGQDPIYLANLKVDHDHKNFSIGIGVRFVGKQFTDNSEDDATAISGYSLVALNLGYRLHPPTTEVKLIEFRLRVNNLLDTEYETVGYGDTYIVGAPRSLYGTVAMEF